MTSEPGSERSHDVTLRDKLNRLPLALAVSLAAALVAYGAPMASLAVAPPWLASALAVALVSALSVITFRLGLATYLYFWIDLVLLQNPLVGLFAGIASERIPLAITEAKTVSAIALLALTAPSLIAFLWRHKWLAVAALLYTVIVLVNLRSVDSASLAYLRNFLFPLVLLLALMPQVRRLTAGRRLALARDLAGYASCVLLVGALLEWVVGTERWRGILHADLNGTLNSLNTSTKVFGFGVSRIGGFLLEPINQGYLAASVVVVLLVLRVFTNAISRQWTFYLVLVAALLSLVLAAAKNGAMMFAMLVVAVSLVLLRVLPALVIVATSVMAFAATLLYSSLVAGPGYIPRLFSDPLGSIGHDSSTFHTAGLLLGVSRSFERFPLGHGLGTGGNFGRIATNSTDPLAFHGWIDTGGESAWGVLAFQAGILALVLFVVVVCMIAHRLGEGAAVVLAVWLSASMFSEAFFGPISSGLLLICGVLLAGVKLSFRHTRTSRPSFGRPRA